MYSLTTLQGLDEAITELEKSISSLPDSSTKKKLIKKFEKLKSVRKSLEGSSEVQNNTSNLETKHKLLILIFCVVFFIFIIYILYTTLIKNRTFFK